MIRSDSQTVIPKLTEKDLDLKKDSLMGSPMRMDLDLGFHLEIQMVTRTDFQRAIHW